MSKTADQLAKILFQKKTVEECTTEEIQQLMDKYPYFGPVRLLLAEKLKKETREVRNDQLQKTLLYFGDPLFLQTHLYENGNAEIISPASQEKSPGQPAGTIAEESIPVAGENELKKEVTASGEKELVFEPFHTVDYFASQGIKIKEEEKPADRFGQQLKSFTEWLKSMKRLPDSPVDSKPVHEEKVTLLADRSVEESSVVTEAMAEVWEKQGNHEKAIEIYSKLSLLNPSKSAYFAGKIEHLKQS
jgi:hypothetical protein